jgi:signal transduction histidine kinase/ligand-binding sensor domain-containing protein
MRAFLLWLILMMASPCGLAIDAARGIHQLQHTRWTASDGAPDDIIVMAQGNDGFLWLGTHAGVRRFDGLRFEPVRARQGSFPDTVALSLKRAADGGMWIGWQVGGISHVKDGVVRNYAEPQGVQAGAIWGFAIGGDGAVWAAGVSGISRFDGRRWQAMGPAQGYTAQKASAVFADRDGRIAVFSENGLFIWQAMQSRFAPPIGRLDLRAPPQQGPDGRIYLLEMRGIRIIESLERYEQLDHRWIYRDTSGTSGSMLVDRAGTLWFDSQYGLHRTRSGGALAPGQLGISSDTESFLPRDGLSNVLVGSMCDDNEGNVWVSTYGGLDRFRQAAPVVLRTRAAPDVAEVFRTQEMLAGPAGAMWLSRDDVLGPLLLAQADGTVLRAPRLGPVSAILAAPGGLWVAARAGLQQLAGEDGRVLRTIAYPSGAAAVKRMRAGVLAPDGSIWGVFSGAGVFQYRDGAWRREPLLPDGGAKVPLALLADAAGRLWLSYADGSVAMLERRRLRTFGPAQGLDLGKIPMLIEYHGQVWAGGQRGVALWRGGRFVALRSEPASATEGVVGLLRARDGSLWLNHGSGAAHISAGEVDLALRDPAHAMRATSYDAVDGLNGSIGMLHNRSVAEADDGKIWFSRQSATFWIDPRQALVALPAPRVEIGALLADGRRVDPPASAGLQLAAGTRDVQFHYNAASLGTPERLQFRYRLDGYDTQWQQAGGRRLAQYTGLGPGSYRFELIAANGDGVDSTVAQLPFRVLPAFYQTWWFRSLCAALLLAAAYGAYRWRLRQHAARLRVRMEAQQAERERIARELHDTLLQGTQAMILHFHNASMAIAEDDPARAAMLRALDDADRMLGEGRDHVHDLRAGDDGGARWSAILRREGERLAAQHGIVFRYAEEGEARMLHARAAHEIYRIASEALRNAFQHARAQVVEVAVRYARGGIELVVRDDGQGLPPVVAANGQIPGHWGMPGMRERAARLGARLSVDGRDGGGTQWRLRVPARRAWPAAHGPLRRWWQRWRRSGVEDAAP